MKLVVPNWLLSRSPRPVNWCTVAQHRPCRIAAARLRRRPIPANVARFLTFRGPALPERHANFVRHTPYIAEACDHSSVPALWYRRIARRVDPEHSGQLSSSSRFGVSSERSMIDVLALNFRGTDGSKCGSVRHQDRVARHLHCDQIDDRIDRFRPDHPRTDENRLRVCDEFGGLSPAYPGTNLLSVSTEVG